MDGPDKAAAARRGGRRRRSARPNDGPEPGSAGTAEAGPPTAAPESLARTIALRQLTAGPRTRHQLAEAMAAKGIPAETIAIVLDRFGAVGLIDDQAFAQSWVESRHAGRGLGRQVLRQELRGKGVDDELIAAAVGSVSDDDELTAARALVRRKLRSMSTLDEQTRTRRLLGQLARRGYGAGVAFAAIRAESGADLEDSLDHGT